MESQSAADTFNSYGDDDKDDDNDGGLVKTDAIWLRPLSIPPSKVGLDAENTYDDGIDDYEEDSSQSAGTRSDVEDEKYFDERERQEALQQALQTTTTQFQRLRTGDVKATVHAQQPVPIGMDDDDDKEENDYNGLTKRLKIQTTNQGMAGAGKQQMESKDDNDKDKSIVDGLMAHVPSSSSQGGVIKRSTSINNRRIRKNKPVKFFQYILITMARVLSFFDLITDIILFIRSLEYENLLIISICLYLSIVSPFILSYSSGIQLFLVRRSFDNTRKFSLLKMLFFILPTGILYFMMLDLLDIVLSTLRVVLVFRKGWEIRDIREFEESFASKMGISRMEWEGLKRQRAIGQLTFETCVQMSLQFILIFASFLFFDDDSDVSKFVSQTEVLISAIVAFCNGSLQFSRIYLEAYAVKETFIQHALNSAMGRVKWLPFERKLVYLLRETCDDDDDDQQQEHNHHNDGHDDRDNHSDNHHQHDDCNAGITPLSFKISYPIPIFSWLLGLCGAKFCGHVDYEFNEVSLNYLVALLSNYKYKKHRHFSIDFHSSLRLLPLQSILSLLHVCKDRNIKLERVHDINVIDWQRSVKHSRTSDKDCTSREFSRDSYGRPWLCRVVELGYPPDENYHVMHQLLQENWDINLQDTRTGETVIFDLLRAMDKQTLHYLFKNVQFEQNTFIYLNYYNKNGVSPLCVALNLYKKEKSQRKSKKPQARPKYANYGSDNDNDDITQVNPYVSPNQHNNNSNNNTNDNRNNNDDNTNNNDNNTNHNKRNVRLNKTQKILQIQQQAVKDQLKLQKSKYLYQILLTNGAFNNVSIKKDQEISPLGYSFSSNGDAALTQDLVSRGCKLNCQEVSMLAQLYVEYAIIDVKQKKIDSKYFNNRVENKEILKDLKKRELDTINVFKYGTYGPDDNYHYNSSTPASPTFGSQGISSGDETMSDEDSFCSEMGDDRSNKNKLELLEHVVLSCGLHISCIVDHNRNNPIHILLQNSVLNGNKGLSKFTNKRHNQQVSIVKALKFECRDWLFQRNVDNDLPVGIAIAHRQSHLLKAIMFDTYDELSTVMLAGEMTFEDEKQEHQRLQSEINSKKDAKLETLNFRLLDHILRNSHYCMLLIDWVIDIVNEILQPHLETVVVKKEKLQNHINNSNNLYNNYNRNQGSGSMKGKARVSVHRSTDTADSVTTRKMENKNDNYYHDNSNKNIIDSDDNDNNADDVSRIVGISNTKKRKSFEKIDFENETTVQYLKIEPNCPTIRNYIKNTNNKRTKKLCDMLKTVLECLNHKSIQLCTFVSDDVERRYVKNFNLFNACSETGQLYVFGFLKYHFGMQVNNIEHLKLLEKYEKESRDAIVLHNSKINDWEYDKRIQAHLKENANNIKLQTNDGGLLDFGDKKANIHIHSQFARRRKTNKLKNREFEYNKNKNNLVLNESEQRKLKNDLQHEDFNDEMSVTNSITVKLGDANENEKNDTNEEKDDKQGIQGKLTDHWIERVYAFMVESLSSADLITDCIILESLYINRAQWLCIVTVLLMLAPYLVSYSVLNRLAFEILQRRELNRVGKVRQQERNRMGWKRRIKKWLFNIGAFTMMTPFNLVYFILLDIFFQVYILLSFVIFVITCFKYDIKDLMDDYIFQRLFQMDRMQVTGYRRLRTLTQLIFESIPALALQIWIIWTHREKTFGIGLEGLILSIIFAICHLICEILIVYVDSHACETSLLKYAIECLWARLEFVPFAETFKAKRDKQIEDIQKFKHDEENAGESAPIKEKEKAKSHCYQTINFEKMEASICKSKYAIEFTFSNQSLKKLGESIIVYLPSLRSTLHGNMKVDNKLKQRNTLMQMSEQEQQVSHPMLVPIIIYSKLRDYMLTLKLGPNSCRNVDLHAISELYRSGAGRCVFDTNNLNWDQIIYENTTINDQTRESIDLLADQWIRACEIKVLTTLLQPRVGLNLNVDKIKKYCLSLTDTDDYLLLFKKYQAHNIFLCLNCEKSRMLYKQIYTIFLKHGKSSDSSRMYIVLFLLWYSIHTIFDHSCIKGCCTFEDYMRKYEQQNEKKQRKQQQKKSGKKKPMGAANVRAANASDVNNNNNNGDGDDDDEETQYSVADTLRQLFSDGYYLPFDLPLVYRGTNEKNEYYCNKRQKLFFSFRLACCFDKFNDEIENILIEQCSQARQVTRHINASTQHRKQYYGGSSSLDLANSDKDNESMINLESLNDKWNNKLTANTMEQFSSFMNGWKPLAGRSGAEDHDVESTPSDARTGTGTTDNDIEDNGIGIDGAASEASVSDVFYPILTIYKYPSTWLSSITQKEVDFLETIVSCRSDTIETGVGNDLTFFDYFLVLDKMVRNWNMKPNYYYLYLLSSMQFRKLYKCRIYKYFEKKHMITIENDTNKSSIERDRSVHEKSGAKLIDGKPKMALIPSVSRLLHNQITQRIATVFSDADATNIKQQRYQTRSFTLAYEAITTLTRHSGIFDNTIHVDDINYLYMLNNQKNKKNTENKENKENEEKFGEGAETIPIVNGGNVHGKEGKEDIGGDKNLIRRKIMGIASIELTFHDFLIEDTSDENENKIVEEEKKNKSKSNANELEVDGAQVVLLGKRSHCYVKIFISIPHKTGDPTADKEFVKRNNKIFTSYEDIDEFNKKQDKYETVFNFHHFGTVMDEKNNNGDNNEKFDINWNDFSIFSHEFTMENNVENTRHLETVMCDLRKNRGLAYFNPWQHGGRNNFYNIRFVVFCGNNRRLSFNQVSASIMYITDETVKPKTGQYAFINACKNLNMPLTKYILRNQDSFDLNGTDGLGRNALHVLCEKPQIQMQYKFLKIILDHCEKINTSHENDNGYTPLDVLENLSVEHKHLVWKERVIELLRQHGGRYKMVNPENQLKQNRSYFDKFVSPHLYVKQNMLHVVDYDYRAHRIAYELIYKIDFDVFAVFAHLLSMNSSQRKTFANKFESYYASSILSKLQEKLAKFDQMSENKQNCISKLIPAFFEDSFDVWANRLKRLTKNINVFKNSINRLCHTICTRTNYELQQMGRAYLRKNNHRLRIELAQLQDDGVKTIKTNGSLSMQSDLRDFGFAIKVFVNLFSLRRYENDSEFDPDIEIVRLILNYDKSRKSKTQASISIGGDSITSVTNNSGNTNVEKGKNKGKIDTEIERIDQFLLYLCSECSWEYIRQFNQHFMKKLNEEHLKFENAMHRGQSQAAAGGLGNGVVTGQSKRQKDLKFKQTQFRNFYHYCRERLDLPIMMDAILQKTIEIALGYHKYYGERILSMIEDSDYLNNEALAVHVGTRMEINIPYISKKYKLADKIIKHPTHPLRPLRLLEESQKRQENNNNRITFDKFVSNIATNAYQFFLLKCLNCPVWKLRQSFDIFPKRDTVYYDIIMPNITDLRYQHGGNRTRLHLEWNQKSRRMEYITHAFQNKEQRIKDIEVYIMRTLKRTDNKRYKQIQMLDKTSLSLGFLLHGTETDGITMVMDESEKNIYDCTAVQRLFDVRIVYRKPIMCFVPTRLVLADNGYLLNTLVFDQQLKHDPLKAQTGKQVMHGDSKNDIDDDDEDVQHDEALAKKCSISLNLLTIENLPFSEILNHETGSCRDLLMYCMVKSTSVDYSDNDQFKWKTVSMSKRFDETTFGYPTFNHIFLFDDFDFDKDSITIKLVIKERFYKNKKELESKENDAYDQEDENDPNVILKDVKQFEHRLSLTTLYDNNYKRLENDIDNSDARSHMMNKLRSKSDKRKYWYLHNYSKIEKVKFSGENTRLLYHLQIQFFKTSTALTIEQLRKMDNYKKRPKDKLSVSGNASTTISPNDMNRATSA